MSAGCEPHSPQARTPFFFRLSIFMICSQHACHSMSEAANADEREIVRHPPDLNIPPLFQASAAVCSYLYGRFINTASCILHVLQ